eukprot:TRINITY_DN26558_c0_g1_i2.p2 TRINITY_DN26558_c0_g1~~TRINITY_DN26558_c0_g1_i2.p2  ORF type:complete len:112 (-),score=6.43 TRINITY_DN26558_c0_g1_i2:14-349(-)
MSSEMSVRNTHAESPRVPAPGQSAQGKPAPKARAKAVVDGNGVNIPRPGGGDGCRKSYLLIGFGDAAKAFQEIAPPYRPYPKPTQVDRQSIPRRLREISSVWVPGGVRSHG